MSHCFKPFPDVFCQCNQKKLILFNKYRRTAGWAGAMEWCYYNIIFIRPRCYCDIWCIRYAQVCWLRFCVHKNILQQDLKENWKRSEDFWVTSSNNLLFSFLSKTQLLYLPCKEPQNDKFYLDLIYTDIFGFKQIEERLEQGVFEAHRWI